MKKTIIFGLTFLSVISNLFGQAPDDEYYSKLNSLDLYYIPDNIRRNIALGRGYDMTDPWYPVIADKSPFLTKPPQRVEETLVKAFTTPTTIPIGSGSNEYKMRYEENIDERTVAQFYHAELRARGISWGVEASVDYVKNQYNLSQGVRFVLENKANIPNDVDINTQWATAPITETSSIEEKSKWKLFKQSYGSHYVTSFSYGYRIEIIAFANTTTQDSKLKLNAAFNAWMVDGKFSAEISDKIKQSNATVDMAIFCQEIKDTRTGSTLPFIARGIADVLKFLDDLKAGNIVITPAPTSISFKSYFASVCGGYPNSCKLFEVKPILADTNAVPRGTILAWTPPSQNIRVIGGQTVIIPPSGGWAICDKKNNQLNPKIPDLTDRFLLGTSELSEVSKTGGSNSHSHGGSTGGLAGYSPGEINYQRGPGRQDQFQMRMGISSDNNIPPYYKVIYIIKL